MPGWLPRWWWRALAALAVLAAVIAATVAAGYPAHRLRLTPGSAWLASDPPGMVTLLDGATSESSGFSVGPKAVGSVVIGAKHDQLQVAQSGLTAYVADATAGTVTRIDGATLHATTVGKFGRGVRVFVSDSKVFAIEPELNSLAVLDPISLAAVHSEPARATDAVVDAAGRIWAIDQDEQRLVSVDRNGAHRYASVADPAASLLVTAAGRPVLLDTAGHGASARLISDDGALGSVVAMPTTLPRPVAASMMDLASGSQTQRRIYVSESGNLLTTDLNSGKSWQVPVGSPADSLAAPVESAALVYIPDFTTSTVAVVDPQRRTVSHTAVIPGLTYGYEFQPYTGASALYYNNVDGTQAGLINSRAVFQAAVGGKYDASNPTRNVFKKPPLTIATAPPASSAAASRSADRAPPPPDSATAVVTNSAQATPVQSNPLATDASTPVGPTSTAELTPVSPVSTTPARQTSTIPVDPASSPPISTTPGGPGSTTAGGGSTTEPDPTMTQSHDTVTSCPTTVSFSVALPPDESGAAVTWIFGDNQSGSGDAASHPYGTTGTYQPSVVVEYSSTDIRKLQGRPITVTCPVTLAVATSGNGSGTVSGPRSIDCPGTCSADIPPSTSVTLVAHPGANVAKVSWAGAGCSEDGTSCTFTITANTTVTAQFTQTAPPPQGQFTMAVSGGDDISLDAAIVPLLPCTRCTPPPPPPQSSYTADPHSVSISVGGQQIGTCTATYTPARRISKTQHVFPVKYCPFSITVGASITIKVIDDLGSGTWNGGGCSGNSCTLPMTQNLNEGYG